MNGVSKASTSSSSSCSFSFSGLQQLRKLKRRGRASGIFPPIRNDPSCSRSIVVCQMQGDGGSDGRNTGCPTILLFFSIFEMFIVGQPVVSLLTLSLSLSLSFIIQKRDSHVFAACRCCWWWCAACCGAACIVWRQLRLDANRNAMGRKSLPSAAVGTFLGNCSIPSYIISLSLSLLALSQRSHTFTLPVYRLLLPPSMWQHFYSSYVHPRPRPLSSAFISYSYPPSVLPQELNLSTTPNTYVETPF